MGPDSGCITAFMYGAYSINLSAEDLRLLDRAFSACDRFVYGLRRYDSTHSIDKSKSPPYLFEEACRVVMFLCSRSIRRVQYMTTFIEPTTYVKTNDDPFF